MDIMNTRLKELRQDKDESQKMIADILQITQQQYQLYESGKRLLPVNLLKILALHYGVSSDYIIGLPKNLNWPR